jgi:hypothetical protein
MRFLIRLKNDKGFSSRDSKRLSKSLYEEVKRLGADVGNLRVSSRAVEFDLLVDSKELMEKAASLLVKKVGDLLTVRELDRSSLQDSNEAVRMGILLFNEERYWESHESLEVAWLRAVGSSREILQAIILIAASLVHLQKGEIEIALSIMKRANAKLPEHGVLFEIDLMRLKAVVSQIIAKGRPIFFKLPVTNTGQV